MVIRQRKHIINRGGCHRVSPSNNFSSRPSSASLPKHGEHVSSLEGSVSNGADSPVVKRTRGQTRGIRLAKKRRVGEKLEVLAPEETNRIVGKNSQLLITETGVLVRKYAPLEVERWGNVSKDDKNDLLSMIKESFCNPYHEPKDVLRFDEVVLNQMKKQYRDHRHRLHKKYFEPYSSVDEAKKHKPPNVLQDSWNSLCDYFNSPKYKAMSERNKANREKQLSIHTAGTKSFSRVSYDKRDLETETEPNPIELYRETHTHTNGSWINEFAEVNYKLMEELRSQPLEEGEAPRVEQEICSQVLGYKSTYIRGRGAGPKPISSSTKNQFHKDLEEARKRAECAEQRAAALTLDIENMRMAQCELEAKQKEQNDMLMSLIEQLRQQGNI